VKKLILVILAIVFAFSSCFTVSAETSKKDDSIEEYYDIVIYDYLTGTEEYKTERLSDEVLQALRKGEVLESPAWFPESFDLPQLSDQLKSKLPQGEPNRSFSVAPYNTFPYSAITKLYLGFSNNGGSTPNYWTHGSGFMVGAKTMITAGHCFLHAYYGWVIQARTYILMNTAFPNYDTTTYYFPATWALSSNFINSYDHNYDYCVINMQNNIGNTTGGFGFGTGGSMLNNTYMVGGYPHLNTSTGIQYVDSGSVYFQDVYTCQSNSYATGGQSGGPIWKNPDNIAWAILTSANNSATLGNRITSSLFSTIQNFKSQ